MGVKLWNSIVFILLALSLPGCASVETRQLRTISTIYDSLIIEIQPTNQCDVQPEAIKKLIYYLDHHSFVHKENIKIIRRPMVIVLRKTWPDDKIDNLIKNTRQITDRDHNDRYSKVFLLCLSGEYESEDDSRRSIAGQKRGNDKILLFRSRSAQSNAEVLLHEFGHIAGLVDRYDRTAVPANPDRPNHCNNKKCTMFWLVADGGEFCKACVKDISQRILQSI